MGRNHRITYEHTPCAFYQGREVRTYDSMFFPVPVTFCTSFRYFFSIVGACVKIYATTTGLVVSTLSAKRDTRSHSDAITSAVLNPHNAYQLITGSLDGHIRVWDILDGVLLQTIGVGHPVRHIAAHEQWKDFLFVAVARPSKKRKGNGMSSVGRTTSDPPNAIFFFLQGTMITASFCACP